VPEFAIAVSAATMAMQFGARIWPALVHWQPAMIVKIAPEDEEASAE
jgi:hypothetical protein